MKESHHSSGCGSMKKRSNFTLVELLVVVAVIIILIGLLMPALNAAREKAKSISCLGNLKQVGVYTAQYMQDNHDYLPAPGYSRRNTYGYSSNYYISWAKLLVSCYVSTRLSDDELNSIRNAGTGPFKVFSCPSAANMVNEMSAVQVYGMNRRLSGTDNIWAHQKVSILKHDTSVYFPKPSLSNTLLYGDSLRISSGAGNNYQAETAVWRGDTAWVTRHGTVCNIAFPDGHAEGLKAAAIAGRCLTKWVHQRSGDPWFSY